jgi:RNA polymerase sigma-70 factor (ECF subfamily)
MPPPNSSDSPDRPDRPDPADFSTDEIVAAVLAGDLEAYRQIVLRYQNEVMRVVNALVFDLSAREDIVQQVFVRAYRALDQYESGRGFGKWLKAIARNLVREELRKTLRHRGRVEAYAKLALERLDSPDDEELRLAREQALRDCLEIMEQQDTHAARAVRWHYLEARQTADIAVEMKRSAGAVRTLLYRARALLRDCLESKLASP